MSTIPVTHTSSLKTGLGVLAPVIWERSVWAIVAMPTGSKAGAAFLLLDPRVSAAQRQELTVTSGANVVLAPASQLSVVRTRGNSHEGIGREAGVPDIPVLQAYTSSSTALAVSLSDAAHAVSTSGSTGKQPSSCCTPPCRPGLCGTVSPTSSPASQVSQYRSPSSTFPWARLRDSSLRLD